MSYQGAVFFINRWDREKVSTSPPSSGLLFFSGLFLTVTRSSRSSQVAIGWEGGCTDHSCSAGLGLVSLTLSKADHTIPSSPPVGQDHDPFYTQYIYHIFCLRKATCTFLAPTPLHVTPFTVETALSLQMLSPMRWSQPGWSAMFVQGKIENCDSVNTIHAGCFTGCRETKDCIVSWGYGNKRPVVVVCGLKLMSCVDIIFARHEM